MVEMTLKEAFAVVRSACPNNFVAIEAFLNTEGMEIYHVWVEDELYTTDRNSVKDKTLAGIVSLALSDR